MEDLFFEYQLYEILYLIEEEKLIASFIIYNDYENYILENSLTEYYNYIYRRRHKQRLSVSQLIKKIVDKPIFEKINIDVIKHDDIHSIFLKRLSKQLLCEISNNNSYISKVEKHNNLKFENILRKNITTIYNYLKNEYRIFDLGIDFVVRTNTKQLFIKNNDVVIIGNCLLFFSCIKKLCKNKINKKLLVYISVISEYYNIKIEKYIIYNITNSEAYMVNLEKNPSIHNLMDINIDNVNKKKREKDCSICCNRMYTSLFLRCCGNWICNNCADNLYETNFKCCFCRAELLRIWNN